MNQLTDDELAFVMLLGVFTHDDHLFEPAVKGMKAHSKEQIDSCAASIKAMVDHYRRLKVLEEVTREQLT